MKIDTMLQREDFYSINEKTLNNYYGKHAASTKLYIYPHLNAIITRNPDRQILKYLLYEYSVRGNILKRIAAKLYVLVCLVSKGSIASHSLYVSADINDSTLIYPCNRKYRIFDFAKKQVAVVAKEGFPDDSLQHEIEFRSNENLPVFIPRLLEASQYGYTESIINGKPLARINNGFEMYREKAHALLKEYAQSTIHDITGREYCKKLYADIEALLTNKVKCMEKVNELCKKLQAGIHSDQVIHIGFSHGDLQIGNIWVENDSEQIYIIDWESWNERSTWYDKATLFDELRPYGIKKYFEHEVDTLERHIVLFEDLVFQLHELNSLPGNLGENLFTEYVDTVTSLLD